MALYRILLINFILFSEYY